MGEGCGGVPLILNLSGIPNNEEHMDMQWAFRNRKGERKGEKGRETEEVNSEQFLATACPVWLLYM